MIKKKNLSTFFINNDDIKDNELSIIFINNSLNNLNIDEIGKNFRLLNLDDSKNKLNKKNLAQYFTTNHDLKNKIYEFIYNKPSIILEPSIGRGDLVIFIKNKISNIIFDMYEIDKNIKLLEGINVNDVIYEDFLKKDIKKKYETIIGNPPFIRTKNGNLYIDFIKKCYNLLEDNGELIFIVPSDFFKLTSSCNLLNEMLINGNFTHIYHPHNEKLFENAIIDIILFRYCKNNTIDKKVLYNDQLINIINSNGLVTFTNNLSDDNIIFKDIFDIYVGIVSGKEEVYKNHILGNIELINGENKIDKYIFIEKFPSNNNDIDTYLLENKQLLLDRGIRKFNENNWFEWGALRNIKIVKNNIGKDCIYIYNITRKHNVCFIGKINYFGGSLLMLKPKKNINLQKIVSYINSDIFKDNYMFSGRFKIGHRCISNSYLPISLLH